MPLWPTDSALHPNRRTGGLGSASPSLERGSCGFWPQSSWRWLDARVLAGTSSVSRAASVTTVFAARFDDQRAGSSLSGDKEADRRLVATRSFRAHVGGTPVDLPPRGVGPQGQQGARSHTFLPGSFTDLATSPRGTTQSVGSQEHRVSAKLWETCSGWCTRLDRATGRGFAFLCICL